MISGTTNTESNYREKLLDSSSSLKDFSFNRKAYYKKYVLGEDVREKDNQAINIGRLVETILLEPELFDNKFHLSACANPPTELMLKFVEALADISVEATNDQGEVTKSFEDMSREAYDRSGYKLNYDAVIKKFAGGDAEIYYEELVKVKAQNLTVVSVDDVSNAERIVAELKSNPITASIVNKVDSVQWEVQKQFQIENFEIDGLPMKAMQDLVLVDHKNKIVQTYDLKTTFAVESFVDDYYMYRRAYIQAYVYYKACLSLTMNKKHEWYGYIVEPPKFIVCDSINYYSPLIYTLSIDDLNDAYTGFEYKGRTYPGVASIISDLKFAMKNNVWNISRENYLNNGIVPIRER